MASQSGVALMALLVLLGLVMALFVVEFAGNLTQSNVTDQRTAEALAMAREALIGYAATYRDKEPDEVFGYLPCPDVSTSGSEGSAETGASACTSRDKTAIGRLPWRTLDLPPLRDGKGECLWYAVSGNFKANLNKTHLMNWDANGLIEIMAPDNTNFVAGGSGTTADPTMRAAAVIFASGAILPGQDRSLETTNPPDVCGGNYDPANYLDTDLLEIVVANRINNATAPSTTAHALTRFIAALHSDNTAATNDAFNDRIVFITPKEIFAARAEKRSDFAPYLHDAATGMLREAAECIAAYGNSNAVPGDRRLPWAAPLVYTNYGLSSNYDDLVNLISGRLPYHADTSGTATNNNLVALTGGILLDDTVCPGWSNRDEFWENFKDHVFYAVADAFKPSSAAGSDPDPCISACLEVDGNPGIAAVLIFAGKKQGVQNRNTNADYSSPQKDLASNFLEGDNASSIQNNTANYTKLMGNDIVICVRKVGGQMTVAPAC